MFSRMSAGFALGSVMDALRDERHATAREALYRLCEFQCEFHIDGLIEGRSIKRPVYAVASNLISRGLPTLPSCRVERALIGALKLTREDNDSVRICYPFLSQPSGASLSLIERSLAVIDPRVSKRLPDAEPRMQGAEPTFFDGPLVECADRWIWQVVELQRPLSSIVADDDKKFIDQMVDFAIDFVPSPGMPGGLVIEIDGEQHHSDGNQAHLDSQRDSALEKDSQRDSALEKQRWQIVRIEAKDASNPPIEKRNCIRKYLDHPWAELCATNWEQPLWTTPEGHLWLQAVLTPLIVARLQKTLIHLVLNGVLDPEVPIWRIAFVERDVPGSYLAVEDLQELMGNLFILEGQNQGMPRIEFRVYRTAEFESFELAREHKGERYEEDAKDISVFDAEIVLDISILQRPGYSRISNAFLARIAPRGRVVTIRSTYSTRSTRQVVAADPIRYEVSDTPNGEKVLSYFLNNIFRKSVFREKQPDIIKEPLRGSSVVGLLPTGAGKSVCYQLPALLQPGITIVIDPLKSLMRDQHYNLLYAGIDTTIFLNSSQKAVERSKAEDKIKQGAVQFVFVSPERFLIQGFRDMLSEMVVPIAYCVIDEAHCVSEWGHDFRTAYLRLGRAARTFCRTNWPMQDNRQALPIIALTGTASFDVLSDVKRELDFGNGVPEVLPDTFERKELTFEIVPIPCPTGKDMADEWVMRKAVYEQKRFALRNLLLKLPSLFNQSDAESFYSSNGEATNSGLVFTPHANKDFGVANFQHYIEREVSELKNLVGRYASSDDSSVEDDLERTQDQYKSNEIGLLIATKAFGMGIDKPNIRYVIHTNFSQSIESYYQEAGRAGRDRKTALCFILYCNQPSTGGDTVDRELMHYFHSKSFKGEVHDMGALEQLLTDGAYAKEDRNLNLDRLFAIMAPGDRRVVIIPFNYDGVDDMVRYLTTTYADSRLTRGIVSKAYKEADTVDEFITRISKNLGGAKARNLPNFKLHRKELEEQLLKRRDEDSTFKAVYRLSIIGLIDDYVVDYKSKVIQAWVEKRPDTEYVEALRTYLARYMAREETRDLADHVIGKSGRGIIRDCLGRLLKFVYSEIEGKRLEVTKQMEGAIIEGIRDGARAFTDRINTYFDSRYTKDLRNRLGDGLADYDLKLVWDFIELTCGKTDNLFHLLGACDRLLAAAPDNGALLLLRAFTRCLSDNDMLGMFSQDFRRGWQRFMDVKDLSWIDYLANMNKFLRYVEQFNNDAVGKVALEITHAHANWLKTINDKFLVTDHA